MQDLDLLRDQAIQKRLLGPPVGDQGVDIRQLAQAVAVPLADLRRRGDVLALAATCRITGISVEYEQPGHEPDVLRRCGDKHVLLGLLNLGTHEVETPVHIAARLREALKVVPAERLHPCSDCGMWFLPREVAFGKIEALAEGTRIVRRDLGLAEPGPPS